MDRLLDGAATSRMERQSPAFVTATAQKFGSVDGLVNNAAIFAALKPKPIDQIDPTN